MMRIAVRKLKPLNKAYFLKFIIFLTLVIELGGLILFSNSLMSAHVFAQGDVTLTPSPTFSAGYIPITGIEDTIVDENRVRINKDLGAHWLRLNVIDWSKIEPIEGERDWTPLSVLEDELAFASKLGLEVILIVRGTPVWAQEIPGSDCGPIKKEKLASFADFLEELVTRYSKPPYNVKYWELGNEPDVDPMLVPSGFPFGCWGDQQDTYYGGEYYAEMLRVVYPQIKAADPNAQVLIGGLLMDCNPLYPGEGETCKPTRFIEGVLKNKGGEFFDGISFHAYDYYAGPFLYRNYNWQSFASLTGPVLVAKSKYLKELLNKFGISDKYMINSEVGLLCGLDGRQPECLTEEYQNSKVSYAIQANASALQQNLRANIWYSLSGWRGTGLVDKNNKPLPAFWGFAFNSAQLNNAHFVRELSQFDAIKGIEFEKEHDLGWILWSTDTSNHSIHLELSPSFIMFDSFGRPITRLNKIADTSIPIGAYSRQVYEIEIGPMPVYIQFNSTSE